MMYTHQKTRSFKQYYATPIVLLIGVCLVLFLLRFHIVRITRLVFHTQTIVSETLQTKKSLIRENQTLKQRVIELQGDVTEKQVLIEENNSLRTLLKYTKNPSTLITTALVVGKPSASLFDKVIINQGALQSVKTGDLVIAGDAVLLGRVSMVTDDTSVVDLYSASGFSSDSGFIIKTLGITVQGHGNGSGNFVFEIPAGVQIIDGDVVTLPQYPERVIAVIKSVDSDPRNPFQKALARTPVNINELKFVQVVRP